MTKQFMFDYIYAILSRYYGIKMTPGYKVQRLNKEIVERIYSMAVLNAKFGDTPTTQVKMIESYITWHVEGR